MTRPSSFSRVIAAGAALLILAFVLGVSLGLVSPRILLVVGGPALIFSALLVPFWKGLRRKARARHESNLHLVEQPEDPVTTIDPPWVGIALARTLLTVVVSVLTSAMLVLTAYIMFVAFPAIREGGDPQRWSVIHAWLGPQGFKFSHVVVGALILIPYIWVTVQGTRDHEAVASRPWLVGATVGGVAGLVSVLGSMATNLLNSNTSQAANGIWAILMMFAAPVLAGVVVGKMTGRPQSAVLGGFWCGVIFALVLTVGRTATDLALADRLVQTIWAGDVDCLGKAGTALAACEVNDDLGGSAFLLLMLPLVSAGLGGLSGLIASVLAASRLPMTRRRSPAVVAPVVFSGILIVLMVAAMTGLMW